MSINFEDPQLEACFNYLRTLCPTGIASLNFEDSGRDLHIWWGDRTKALGDATRISHGINSELDGDDEVEVEVEDDEDEEQDEVLELERHGMYL